MGGGYLENVIPNKYGHFVFLVMSFVRINALAAFMDIINRVFRKYLLLFLIIFIDDTLIYSRTVEVSFENSQG